MTNRADAAKVAAALLLGGIQFSWTSGGSAYDVYVVPMPSIKTWMLTAPGGKRGPSVCLVAVERIGCFYFELLAYHWGKSEYGTGHYVSEKLGLPMDVAKQFGKFLDLIREASTPAVLDKIEKTK